MKLVVPRKYFLIVTVSILLLPISMEYKLFLFGERTTATVIILDKHGEPIFNSDVKSDLVDYFVESHSYRRRTPMEIEWKTGTRIGIIYEKQNPHRSIFANPLLLYASYRVIFVVLLQIVWLAFYFSFREGKT